MAIELYAQQQQKLADANISPQQIEGQALIQLAGRMSQGLESINDSKQSLANLKEQVRLNWRVWTIIQSYLVDENCELPLEIRENLLSLTRFIDQQTVDFLSSGDVEKISALVNINCQIGMGLLGEADKSSALIESIQGKEPKAENDNGADGVRASSKQKLKINRIQGIQGG